MSQNIVTHIIHNIYRFNEQYFYGSLVNTYLIELESKIILFDLPTYSERTKNYLKNLNKPIECILSHGSCGIEDGKLWQKELNVKVYLHEADRNYAWLRMKPDLLFSQPFLLSDSLQVILTPGHTAGSVCLLDTDSKSLLCGDTFGGNEDGTIRNFLKFDSRNDNTDQLIQSCKNLLNFDFQLILPFHYQIIENDAKNKLQNLMKQEGLL